MITYTTSKFNNITKNITKFFLSNNININDSEQKVPENIMNEFQLYISSLLVPANKFLSTPCPKCGKAHFEPFLSSYQRNVIFRIGNLLVNIKLSIPRVRCCNCGSTHAILPDFCIPLKQYSNQAIISIATDATNTSTEIVAEKLNIDSKQVRRCVNIIKSNINNILLLYHKYMEYFKSKISLNTSIANILYNMPQNFIELFFYEFRFIFLYNIKIKRKLYMQYKKLSI